MSIYNIKVIGVGGGGSNTIDYIMETGINGVQTYAVNTDAQALENSRADKKLHIGKVSTNGLGAGALPEIGRKAAEESAQEIINELHGADIVFVAAGMGGGTGTGAAPFIAGLAKKMGILTIGIVTKPFKFEGPSRMKMALDGLSEFENNSDVAVVIPNEKLIQNHRHLYIEDAFVLPDNILKTAIEAILNILDSVSGFTSNVDLNTLRSTLVEKGLAVMGVGDSNDQDLTPIENLMVALKNAINSEILEISVHGAREFIVLITANSLFMKMEDLNAVGEFLSNELGYEIKCTLPIRHRDDMNEYEREITLIATDYENREFVEKIINPEPVAKFDDSLFVGL